MKRFNTLLVVDDNCAVLTALSLLLRNDFEKVTAIRSPSRIDEILRCETVDCVLLDMNFSAADQFGQRRYLLAQPYQEKSPDIAN